MLPLAETQLRLRDAVVGRDASRVAGLLVGGNDPEKRLAIHQRHYHSSLVTALLVKFPALAWLVGTPALEQAARDFVRDHPPRGPCIAEYGDAFPQFIAARAAAERMPYLHAFAELEWHLGQVSIAVDAAPVSAEELSQLATDILLESTLTLQPGVRYLAAAWPVDELMKLYLTETAPDEYRLAPADVWLEIRGARGQFDMVRLDAAEFGFRQAIQDGRPLGDAAEHALNRDGSFDAGRALLGLVHSGLVIAVTAPDPGQRS